MKLLLDENFPQKVSIDFPDHTFITVDQAGWKGKKNGELLELMMKNGFAGMVTLDRNLAKQQNLARFDVKIFVLKTIDNRPSSVKPLVDKLHSALNRASKDQVVEIV